MTAPLVTIVTPSLNQGAFIRATIESVLSQDYPHIEYVVMDGGSTDNTSAIAAEYSSRLKYVSEKDRGQSHAINKGFTTARGEVLAWLNSDDLLLPGAVGKAVAAMDRAGKAGAIYGEGYRIDRKGANKGRFPATEPFNLWKLVYLSDYILQQSTFFRKSAVDAVGGVDEDLHYAMDWDLLIRLGKRFGLYYEPEYLGAIREYAEAKSFAGGARRIGEIQQVLQRHTGLEKAPGFLTYAWQSRQAEFRTKMRRRLPRGLEWLSWGPALGAWTVSATAVEVVSRRAQGYFNGWAANQLRWMIPEGSGEVVLRGETPDHGKFAEQELIALSDGQELGRMRVGRGAFEFRFSAPGGHAGPLAFEIHAARWARKLATAGRLNWRRAAFRLVHAGWASESGEDRPETMQATARAH